VPWIRSSTALLLRQAETRADRDRKGEIERPAAILDATDYGAIPYAFSAAVFLERHPLPTVIHVDAVPAIAVLLFASGPSAVLRGIRTIIINAIKHSAFGPRQHVLREVRE
jgi:hypothetical protein